MTRDAYTAVPLGTRVKVYRNLQRTCYSVTHAYGLLAGYATALVLEAAVFHVRPGGRAKVLETRRKNVHAFVIGRLVAARAPAADAVRVRYDPYAAATFTRIDGSPVHAAQAVVFTENGVYAEGIAA